MRTTRQAGNRVTAVVFLATAAMLVGGVVALRGTSLQQARDVNDIVRLLANGQPVFGIFSGDKTAAQGATLGTVPEIDFVFYSLEQGPFDLPQMQVYMSAMRDAAGAGNPHPLALRIPPIRDDADLARTRVRQALDAGVSGIVFPHVETAREAAAAVSAMGPDLWPRNTNGQLVAMLIVEDQAGVQNVRDIVRTTGVSVVFAGPGDLRRAYEGDMEAVEGAIQTVLSACNEFDVPCGITAGVDDIAGRLRQGFRVFIVSSVEALTAGRDASGRSS